MTIEQIKGSLIKDPGFFQIDFCLSGLNISNSPGSSLPYYYFLEYDPSLKSRFIYKKGSDYAVACYIEDRKFGEFAIIRGVNDLVVSELISELIKEIKIKKCYFNTNIENSKMSFPFKIHDLESNKGFYTDFEKLIKYELPLPEGFEFGIIHKNGQYESSICHQGKLVSSCKTLWKSTGFSEMGGSTDPAFRKKGFFGLVVYELAVELLKTKIIPIYVFEGSNAASERVATKLGFLDSGYRETCFYYNGEA